MSGDIFVPSSKPEDALVGPLHTITYITADKSALQQMLCDGMDLERSDWLTPTADERQQLDSYFGFCNSRVMRLSV